MASPHDRQLWAYNIEVAREAAEAGFDEIQFDYVRFPATGRALDKQLDFKNPDGASKALTIHNFLNMHVKSSRHIKFIFQQTYLDGLQPMLKMLVSVITGKR